MNKRWLGGTLTNNITISNSVKKLKRFEEDQNLGVFDQYQKKRPPEKQKVSEIALLSWWNKRHEYLPKPFLLLIQLKKN